MPPHQIELDVPGFGLLHGVARNGIAEFLNVPFGVISRRFAPSTLFRGRPGASFDCTKQGPLCPQAAPFNDNYNGVPLEACKLLDVRYDELACLNLRLQVPVGSLNTPAAAHAIPTVVWLHGGSNIAGTPYRGSSDAQRWLELAVARGQPFALVTAHYRVGVFGWLPMAGHANVALGDQRRAVEWVREFGRAWNADLAKISLIGQSSGASDAFAHLCDPNSYSLVAQIGMLSGHVGSSGFASSEDYDRLRDAMAAELAATGGLDASPWESVVAAQTNLGLNVFATLATPENSVDGAPNYEGLNHVRTIVGDCGQDGFFFAEDPKAVDLLTQLGIKEDPGEFYTNLVFRRGANEIWGQPAQPAVFRQLCDAVNPYSPDWGNNHMVELHYIINGYATRPEFAEAVRTCQEVWLDLVHLQTPWDPETECFYLPPRGKPRVVAKKEAEEMRKLPDGLDTHSKELVRVIRGWP